MWHDNTNECPQETFSPKIRNRHPERVRAKGAPPTLGEAAATTPSSPPSLAQPSPGPAAAPSPGPSRSMLQLTTRPADVSKGATPKTAPTEFQDYIVGKDRVRAMWNLGFRVLEFVCIQIDDVYFGYAHHIPHSQFVLSDTAELTLEEEPRNFYARAVTWTARTVGQAKTLEQANRFVDSVLFMEAFGGIAVVIVLHYRKASAEGTKAKERKEKRAKERSQFAAKRKDAVDAQFTPVQEKEEA